MAKSRQQPAPESRPIPLPFQRGMWAAGDGARLPAGYCRKLRNFRNVDGVLEWRPPFVFDTLTGIHGLFAWEDDANKVTRLGSVDDSGNVRVKAISGETWEAPASGTASAGYLTSFATYRKNGWGTVVDASGVPTGIFRYDGATVDNAPLNSAIVARKLLFAKDRLFLFHPRVTVVNLHETIDAAYTAAGGAWNLADVDARTITAGSATIGEIIPTATSDAFMYANVGSVNGLTAPEKRVWLRDIHNTSPNYQMPITLEMRIANPWTGTQPYAQDEIVTPSASNGYFYRAATPGTSSGSEPASWPTTIGDTVDDGTVKWLCARENVFGQKKAFVPTSSLEPSYTRYYMEAELPETPGEYTVRAYLLFGNTSSPTITPAALHIGYRDGLPDGDPQKKNFGSQVTAGDLYPPFFNAETLAPATLDLPSIIWSEVADPPRIRAVNFYRQSGQAGYDQNAVLFDGLIYVFKRRSYIAFAFVDDPNLVILPQAEETLGVGCVGPLALDVHDGALYWIGEDDVYRLKAGDGQRPVGLCGDGMRAAVMGKLPGSWVDNAAILRADPSRQVIMVMTQRGIWFEYDIVRGAWSQFDAEGGDSLTPVGATIRNIAYHPVTETVYVSFGTAAQGTPGLARMSPYVAQPDQISTTGAATIYGEFWPMAIETVTPHSEIQIDTARFRYSATATQSLNAQVSFDCGRTFTRALTCNIPSTQPANEKRIYEPIDISLYQSWNTVQMRLLFGGEGGSKNLSISEAEADILLRGYYSKVVAVTKVSTL